MKTVEQWLKEKDLPTELGGVLTPGKEWKHIYEYGGQCTWGNPDREGAPKWRHCKKCDMWWHRKKEDDVLPDVPCSVPDPITIDDWNIAIYHFRQQACGEEQLRPLMDKGWFDVMTWAVSGAQPKHYLIAAAMAMERKEE